MSGTPSRRQGISERAADCHDEDGQEDTSSVEPPTVAIAGYTIRGVLGIGGFGTVWDAIHEVDGLPVAIKTVHSEQLTARERLVVEAAALRTIGPPHVPELFAQGELADGSPYMVFERLDLPSLASKLGQPMALGQFYALAGAILDALGAAHARGILHRDIKPDNIFVGPGGAKLIDFGLAKPVSDADEAAQETTLVQTADGVILGTPLYMSPEQCEGLAHIDARADIYAAGVVFYEMLTGRTPFVGDPVEVRMAHISRRPAPPSRLAPLPAALDQVIGRCLAKVPERRFADVAALAAALEAARASDASRGPAAASNRLPAPTAADPPAPAPPVPSGQLLAAMSEQQLMAGLLYFETDSDTATVQSALMERGGRLVSILGARCVAVFGLDSDDNPVERAVDAARSLIARGLTARITVERERVRVHRSPDGSQRVLSPALHCKDRLPLPSDPTGILLTAASASAMAGVRTALVPGRDSVVALVGRSAATSEPLQAELLGRERVVCDLMAGARHALDARRPTIATVLAETGHGKSHLAATVLAALERTATRVIHLRAGDPLGGDKHQSARQLLVAALELSEDELHRGQTGDDGRALVCERLGAELGDEVWPAVALALGWLSADAPGVRKLSAAPAALRAAVARAAGAALRSLASRQRVSCVLDDAHFADGTTLDALEYAALAEAQVPLWICVLARPSFIDARPHWGGRAAGSQTVHLARLPADSAAALCRRLLEPAQHIPEQIIARLVAQTQGSPLLLTELARAIKRHGLIRRHERGHTWYLAVDELDRLPELPGVEWMIERELAALPDELAAHVRLLALLAAEVSVAEVDGVLGELDRDGLGEVFCVDAWVATRRLVEHGLLTCHDRERIAFRHEVLKEQVARTVPAALRERIHGAAYRYYRGAAPMAEERRLPLMAHHGGRSGAPDAASMFLALAERARQRHGYLEAGAMYSRALELMDADDTRMRMQAYNGRGLMHYRLSRFGDALRDLGQARALARALEDVQARAELLLDEATVLDWMRDFQASQARVERAETLAARAPSPLLCARVTLGLGRACFRRLELDEAIAILQKAADAAELLGDDGYETLVIALMLLGWALGAQRDHERAKAVFARSISLCEDHGDKLHLAAVLNNRRDLWISEKNVERALRDATRAQQIGREVGQIAVEYVTSYNLAELFYLTAELAAAQPHIRRAVELEPSCSQIPHARLLEARLCVLAGDMRRAGDLCAELVRGQQQARERGEADGLFSESQQILCEAVALAVEGAGHHAWCALTARAAQRADAVERADALEMMALCREREGDLARAAQSLQDALDICARTPHIIEERIRAHLQRVRSAER